MISILPWWSVLPIYLYILSPVIALLIAMFLRYYYKKNAWFLPAITYILHFIFHYGYAEVALIEFLNMDPLMAKIIPVTLFLISVVYMIQLLFSKNTDHSSNKDL